MHGTAIHDVTRKTSLVYSLKLPGQIRYKVICIISPPGTEGNNKILNNLVNFRQRNAHYPEYAAQGSNKKWHIIPFNIKTKTDSIFNSRIEKTLLNILSSFRWKAYDIKDQFTKERCFRKRLSFIPWNQKKDIKILSMLSLLNPVSQCF